MIELSELVGQERSVHEVAQAIYFQARRVEAPVVGALHVTCSDESEGEGIEAFQQEFVQYLLPPLKFAQRSPFRTASLGGRYEWSSVRIAEAHFAGSPERSAGKLLVVKINAHVAAEAEPGLAGQSLDRAFRFGAWQRYGRESACCGALNALVVHDVNAPYADDLREVMQSEGVDRLAMLRDPARVEPQYAPLYAAIVSARLQARKAVMDIQDHTPLSPTLYVVLPSVTINRHERDTEVVCGVYVVDTRDGRRESTYSGLGDDPSAFVTRVANQRLAVTDDHVGQTREARDHRALVKAALDARLATRPLAIVDERLQRLRKDVAGNKHLESRHARSLLRVAVPLLAEVAPIPAAVLAFGDGAVGINHAFRIHRLARTMEGDADAQGILREIHSQIDVMDDERAEALVELLTRDYRG